MPVSKPMIRWAVMVGLVVGAVAIFMSRGQMSAGPSAQGGGGPGGRGAVGAPVVEIIEIKPGRVTEISEAVGTLRANESIVVTPKISGFVQSIHFEEGQSVKANDLLVRFDADEKMADKEQAAAESRRAYALRDEIRVKLERAQALRKTGAGTEAQVNDFNAQMRSAETAMAAAEARRKAADARFEDAMIRAPFGGRMGGRAISVGAYVSPGTRISTLDDVSRMKLDFSMPENQLGRLHLGQIVRASSPAFGARIFTGRVTLIDPRVDPATRSLRLTAEFDNSDQSLKPGMFLSVMLETRAKDDALMIPEEALVGEGLRQIVFIVKDNKIERRVVRIGQRQGGLVEILEGVSLGENLVVRGVQRLRAGQSVTVKPPTPPAAPPPAPASQNMPLATDKRG
jgi:membrane fusion protein, multidrug efflux system